MTNLFLFTNRIFLAGSELEKVIYAVDKAPTYLISSGV